MGHSERCSDPTTYYEIPNKKCVPCVKPDKGYETTPNCGYDDYGGRHEMTQKKCPVSTFNDGAHYHCQPCSSCPQDFIPVTPCNGVADTKCQAIQHSTAVSVTSAHWTPTPQTGNRPTLTQSNPGFPERPTASYQSGVVPLAFIICTTLMVLSCWAICVLRKRGYKTSSHVRAQFTPLPDAQETNELKDILSPDLLAAPLQSVLDNLDVLEELVMLLDPETSGTKNTKHLASLCNFSAKWVIYIYSHKDSKSPLKALLEGVTSRHPEWTVGHLAELLRQIERMDAIVALGKLRADTFDIINV